MFDAGCWMFDNLCCVAPGFSRTMPPRLAVGGWIPRSGKPGALMYRNTKQKRRPNPAIRGGIASGRISGVMTCQNPAQPGRFRKFRISRYNSDVNTLFPDMRIPVVAGRKTSDIRRMRLGSNLPVIQLDHPIRDMKIPIIMADSNHCLPLGFGLCHPVFLPNAIRPFSEDACPTTGHPRYEQCPG